MNVVWHHTQFNDNDVMSIRDFSKDILAKFFDILILEHVVSVFGAPFQMVYILAYAMVIANQFHDLCPGQVFKGPANAGAPAQHTERILEEK